MSFALIKHLDYTIWATTKVSQILENLDESILKKETPSSFNTLEKTVLHIWDAGDIWLKRLQGQSISDWPSKDFAGDGHAALKGWLQNAKALKDYIASEDEDYYLSIIAYRDTMGTPLYNTVEEIILHVASHATYHRGQLITMLRANGITALPDTDLMNYLRSID